MWHRKPAVAGAFYTSNPSQLLQQVKMYINEAENSETGKVIGVIAPHAGYMFSGPVAGHAYKIVKEQKPEVVVVLAPSHRARFEGASVIPEGSYETPLGQVEIDSAIGNALLEEEGFEFLKQLHQAEHSLEVQVPFLQGAIDDFTLVPIIVATINLSACRKMADTLHRILKDDGRSFMIVISTDLSHFHGYNEAMDIDGNFAGKLKLYDEEALSEALKNGEAEACGEGPVLTGMALCKKFGAKEIKILKYQNSGDTAGDKSRVVGYLSAAII